MTERKKDLLIIAALLAGLILFFSKILFTHQIIRAPDIINEFYWGVEGVGALKFWDLFRVKLVADWNMYINSGLTLEGGGASGQFLFFQRLVFWLFPAPASVAWYIVFHLFIGAVGTYCYCRLIGTSRVAALLGGLIFAIAPENASLINAGHVMKMATISFAPWAFYFFEKGFQTRRVFYFLTTAMVLAYQFFHTHWQIAYYTCLGIGVYGIMRCIGIIIHERKGEKKELARIIGLNLVTMFFFLSTVAISLAPLANWSKGTNRGAESGANSAATSAASQSKGGLDREEAMSWSLPPEELGALIIPGFFGLSRQEAGQNPSSIPAYYWGRMVFTQTVSYMGLLPWLLLPLPLIFRRDRYTWLAVAAVAGGIIFSMGKYTFVYNLLYDYFPGINRFRVPKMMMFMPLLGLGVLAARGIDLLLDEGVRGAKQFRWYLAGVLGLPVLLLLLLGVELAGRDFWLGRFYEMLAQPTRYEQGPQLVTQRWDNLVTETGIAAGLAALLGLTLFAFSRKWRAAKALPFVLLTLYLADVGRINDKFTFLVNVPEKVRGAKTPVMEFLARESKEYRVLPADGSDPMQYVAQQIPVMFTSNPVQQRRWQEFLDAFSFSSAMPDIINVKYLVYGRERYERENGLLGDKYLPAFKSPDGSQVVMENRRVMPKGWLVPAVLVVNDPLQGLAILQNPAFDPRGVAVVETPPPVPMAGPTTAPPRSPGNVTISRYESEHIALTASVLQNALLVLGEKYYRGWKATVDGSAAEIYPVDHILRGVYLTPGSHRVEFVFDPLPFKVGKYLTLASFALFTVMVGRELWPRRARVKSEE